MTSNQAKKIIDILKQTYPEATCSLDFTTPFELLVAVMLSAQCTDERVNKTTPSIFPYYSCAADFNSIPLETLETLIHPCGFYKTKETAKIIVENFKGEVPMTMEELTSLPGVGRKSANVILLEAFHNPQGIAVDTHAKRISNRVGFSNQSDPIKIEQDLLTIFPKEYYQDINHLFVWHGRNTCISRSPKCSTCPILKYCSYATQVLTNRKDLNISII